MSKKQALIQLIDERQELTNEKRQIENQLSKNQHELVEMVVTMGAFHCLTVNLQRVRRLL